MRKGKQGLRGMSNGGRWEEELLHVEGSAAFASASGAPAASGKRKRRHAETAGSAAPPTSATPDASAGASTAAAAGSEAGAADDALMPARPRNTWLACDRCGQWRRLGKMKDTALPEVRSAGRADARLSC